MAGIWWFVIGLGAGLVLGAGLAYGLLRRTIVRSLEERSSWMRAVEPPFERRMAAAGERAAMEAGAKEADLQAGPDLEELRQSIRELQADAQARVEEDVEEMAAIDEQDIAGEAAGNADEAPPPRPRGGFVRRIERSSGRPGRGREVRAAMEEALPEETAVGARPPTDLVHFSVSAPPSVLPETTFLLSVWAHLEVQRTEVLERARQELGEEPAVHTRGPARVARGTRLVFHVEVEGLVIEEPVGWVDWEGEIAQASFFVDVPAGAAPGNHKGRVSVLVEGLPILEMRFLIRVGESAAIQPLEVETRRYRSAFASYSSKDRAEVFKRIQGIHQVAPDLDIFVDVDSLRSGQAWEQELYRQIAERDVFFLFWSQNASRSRWVKKEWEFALAQRGLDFIDPVPLEPPEKAPPPPELAGKHFNDRELVFIKAYSGRS